MYVTRLDPDEGYALISSQSRHTLHARTPPPPHLNESNLRCNYRPSPQTQAGNSREKPRACVESIEGRNAKEAEMSLIAVSAHAS